jgi:uncharacterized protein YijF (DUF1287 family)
MLLVVLIIPAFALDHTASGCKCRNRTTSYEALAFPGGDVPIERGVCTDVVIRAYRAIGVDLQLLVNQDMRQSFSAYPKLWGLSRPDPNIDHRRVPNLAVFFGRHRKTLPVSKVSRDYEPGDIVAWRLFAFQITGHYRYRLDPG